MAEFGKAIKGGIFLDQKNTEKIQDLLIFESSDSADVKTTLKEYVDRMPEQQKVIYYTTGESRQMVEKLPQMEVVKEKKMEVLYFLDKIDEFLTQHLREYSGKRLQSVSRGDLDLPDDEPQNTEVASDDHYKDLLEFMRDLLKDNVKEVRISKRLKSSPACLVSSDSGYSINMERLMREANQPMFRATRILEINPDHDVIKTIDKMFKSDGDKSKLSGCCQLVYDQAVLVENHKMDDPIRFANMVSNLIVEAYG